MIESLQHQVGDIHLVAGKNEIFQDQVIFLLAGQLVDNLLDIMLYLAEDFVLPDIQVFAKLVLGTDKVALAIDQIVFQAR